MNQKTLMEDVDYIKTLAQEGADTPLLGGRFGIMWGCLTVIALITHWATLTGRFPLQPANIGLIWMMYGITGSVLTGILGRMLKNKPGCYSVSNRVEQAVWVGTTIMIFTLAIAIAISVTLSGRPVILFDMIMPTAFGVYFLNYFAIASLSGQKSLRVPAFISLLTMVITLNLIGDPLIYLVSALGVIFAGIVPSLIFLKNEPSDVV